jgi:hypothetical protein
MNLSGKCGAVADVEIDGDDLQALRSLAAERGRDVRKYLLDGVECAYDLALKREREERERFEGAHKEAERIAYHEASVKFRKDCEQKDRSNPRGYGRGKRRDPWGNEKRVLAVK